MNWKQLDNDNKHQASSNHKSLPHIFTQDHSQIAEDTPWHSLTQQESGGFFISTGGGGLNLPLDDDDDAFKVPRLDRVVLMGERSFPHPLQSLFRIEFLIGTVLELSRSFSRFPARQERCNADAEVPARREMSKRIAYQYGFDTNIYWIGSWEVFQVLYHHMSAVEKEANQFCKQLYNVWTSTCRC